MELETQIPVSSNDAAKAAIIGAFCGDAAGGTLEFLHVTFTEELVCEAMMLEGGGAMGLGPGQITDDSELALSLAHGLTESKGVLNLDNIVRYYGMWVSSPPFDIGTTTGAESHRQSFEE